MSECLFRNTIVPLLPENVNTFYRHPLFSLNQNPISYILYDIFSDYKTIVYLSFWCKNATSVSQKSGVKKLHTGKAQKACSLFMRHCMRK